MAHSWALAPVLAAALLAAGTAHAARLDFVAEAAGNERGIASGTTLTIDGLDVTFTSSNFPYFDDLSGGKPGGLGVCKTLSQSFQCQPGNDDNITVGESVTLSFAAPQILSEFSFTNADHNNLNGSTRTLLVGLNGVTPAQTRFVDVVGATLGPVQSITFAYGGGAPSQFYLNAVTATPVPLPAAAGLLAGALAGLGALRRRA